MKKTFRTFFQIMGLLTATYFTCVLIVLVYNFLFTHVADQNIYMTAIEEVKVQRMISSH